MLNQRYVIGTSFGLPDVEPLVWKIKAISSSCDSDMSGNETDVPGVNRSESDSRARNMGRGKSFNIDSKDAS